MNINSVKRKLSIKKIILSCIICGCHFIHAQVRIDVDCSQKKDSNILFAQGFLHGGAATVDSNLMKALKPQFWRIGAYMLGQTSFESVRKYNPKITMVINDLYMITQNISDQKLSKPWTNNWFAWDTLVTFLAKRIQSQNGKIDFWDVWGEPDEFWTGSYGQWIEMYRRTDSILHKIIPSAKMSGPEFAFAKCIFSHKPILQFIDSLHAVNSRIDAVSWHEFCYPDSLPYHVKSLKDSLKNRPWFQNYTVHISEYGGPKNHTIPGWNLGWLYYFEESNVDWVSHACWNENDNVKSWTNCETGMNGLFMSDNKTTQPNYWLHRGYAELHTERLYVASNETRTIGMASIDNTSKEIKLLIGRYDKDQLGQHGAPKSVKINLKNIPFCSSCSLPLEILRIPSNTAAYAVPLKAPLYVNKQNVQINGDSTSFSIDNFVDGDVYLIYLNPAPGSVLKSESPKNVSKFILSPNPVSDKIKIEFQETLKTVKLSLYSTTGNELKSITIQNKNNFILDVNELENGIYFVQLEINGIKTKTEKIQVIHGIQ